MNTRILPLITVLFLSAGWVFAQNDATSAAPANGANSAASSPPANRAGLAQQTTIVRRGAGALVGGAGSRTGPARNLGPALKDNVMLSLKGTYVFDTPIDFSVTGAGPQFIKSSPLSSPGLANAMFKFDGAIRETADGYWLEYTLGASVPVTISATTISANGGASTISYRDISFSSSVNLKAGQPVVILNNDGQVLTLTLTKDDAR